MGSSISKTADNSDSKSSSTFAREQENFERSKIYQNEEDEDQIESEDKATSYQQPDVPMSSAVVEEPFEMICSFCKKSFNPRSDARILPCNHFICGPYCPKACVTRMILNGVPECPSNTCRVTFPNPFITYNLPKVDKQNGAGKSSAEKKKGQ